MITEAAIQHAPACRYAIAVSGEEAARLCGLSGRTWRRLDAQGLVPRAVRIGRSRRWSVDELCQWLAAECPARARWESIKKVAGNGHGHRRQGQVRDYTRQVLPVSSAATRAPSAAVATGARAGLSK